MEGSLHPMAARYGEVAGVFDAIRPGYPGEVAELLTERLGVREGSQVLDAGAGTGKLTSVLLATGAEVTAAEPVAAMRSHLLEVLAPERVLDARAEALPVGDGAFDVVCAGDAFHYFDPERGPRELARVLRSGGHLVMISHSPFPSEAKTWRADLQRLLRSLREDHPFFVKEHGRRALRKEKAFGPVRGVTLAHHHEVDRWGLVDYVRSLTYVQAIFDDRERYETVMAQVREIADQAPPRISLSYGVEVWITKRR